MTLPDEIKQFFATHKNGALPLKSLPDEYPAYAIRTSEGFGVALEWDSDAALSEHFANANFYSSTMMLGGADKTLLILQSYREDLRNEFACVCAQFVDPGKEGAGRASILSEPLSWWKKWRNLLGNVISDKAPYSVLCEMMVLDYVRNEDSSAEWTAAKSGTHDIESENRSYEVKSTIRRYGAEITISGQFQLLTPKPLDLFFCRVEESPAGISINDMKKKLVDDGYNEGELEHQLSKQGYELGASSRVIKYSVLEKRRYHIDDSFPKITEASFKGDKIPNGITHITYSVDLETIPYTTW